MTDLRTAAQQALEALEYAQQDRECPSTTRQAITALRAALAEPTPLEDVVTHGSAWSKNGKRIDPMSVYAEPVQEPVALNDGRLWQYPDGSIGIGSAPPQRKPLTEEEIDGLMQSIGLRCADDGNERMANHAEWERRQRRRIARAIERAHGIT